MKKTPGRTEVRSSCAWESPCSRGVPSRCRGLKRSVTERRFVRMVLPVWWWLMCGGWLVGVDGSVVVSY